MMSDSLKPVLNKVEYLPLSGLSLHPANPRFIKDSQFQKLCESIKNNLDYFETRPILVNKERVIFAGNMRYRAAKHLGMKEVPAVIMDIPLERQNEILIRDNRQNGEWDMDVLANSFDVPDLLAWGFDPNELSFDLPTTEDDVPAVDTVNEPICQLGDIYQLGNHRLLCGDSTNPADIDKLVGKATVGLCFTDPPYNVAYVGGTKQKLTIDNDKMTPEQFHDFVTGFTSNILRVTKGAIYVCMSSSEWPTLQGVFTSLGGHWSRTIIWAKDRLVLSRSDYHSQMEPISVYNEEQDEEGLPILYGWPDGVKRAWNGGRKQTDIWRIDRPSANVDHPTMKPIALVARALRNSSNIGDVVFDPFGGSGSTLIACEQTGRVCYTVELAPRYCDVIVRRYEQFTGEKAVKL